MIYDFWKLIDNILTVLRKLFNPTNERNENLSEIFQEKATPNVVYTKSRKQIFCYDFTQYFQT